ncbi:hypothetical protein SAMN04488103_12310 [Gemmobacter aquatilis]|uniref:Uncharacterized protein n=1 Tax=Gemmobacter aquatilis TaxID=933059 RepID=A0A1H8NT93_9RHOB|nr:hypothetical protein [Gemmobacter aquatilis]SEO32613.1 hypothetical protein SAMN04488103_12310 [Gemmobacter aquatilis]
MKFTASQMTLWLLFFILAPSISLAQSQPLSGTMIGSSDGDIMSFECELEYENRINCEFVQILISKDKPLGQWDKVKSDFVAAWPKENSSEIKEVQAMACEMAKNLELALGSDINPAIDEQLRIFVSDDRVRAANLAESSRKSCANPTKENFEPIIYDGYLRGTQTCRPMVNKYNQEFVKISDDVWTVESSPSGSCGAVNTSRFVRDPKARIFWNYTASKVITNKSGEALPGIECAQLDEGEYHYVWDAPPKKMDCIFFD